MRPGKHDVLELRPNLNHDGAITDSTILHLDAPDGAHIADHDYLEGSFDVAALQDTALAEINHADTLLERLIANIENMPGISDLDIDRTMDGLIAKASELAMLKAKVAMGSPAAVATALTHIHEIVASVSTGVSAAGSHLSIEKGVLMAEITIEKLPSLSIDGIASLTSEHFRPNERRATRRVGRADHPSCR
jgi:hypothetical protein